MCSPTCWLEPWGLAGNPIAASGTSPGEEVQRSWRVSAAAASAWEHSPVGVGTRCSTKRLAGRTMWSCSGKTTIRTVDHELRKVSSARHKVSKSGLVKLNEVVISLSPCHKSTSATVQDTTVVTSWCQQSMILSRDVTSLLPEGKSMERRLSTTLSTTYSLFWSFSGKEHKRLC